MTTFARPATLLEDRLTTVVRAHGRDGFAWMTTWAGHDLWFDEGGASVVAYRVSHGVALTTGGPVGPAQDLPRALAGFVAFCREQGWRPCFWSVGDDVRAALVTQGWGSVQVAEEAVLPLGTLTFTGKRFQDVRTASSRARREGITARWVVLAEADPALRTAVEQLSRSWCASKPLPEMGFTLGGLAEAEDPAVRLLVAVDATGALLGLVSWLPAHDGGRVVGWTLDLMRRAPAAPNGVMETLIAHAVLQFQEEGAAWASLSGAPLARTVAGDRGHRLVRLLDAVGRALEPVYGFRSLLAFKAKFAPELRPVHACYPSAAALPRLALAVGDAYLPDVPARRLVRLVARGLVADRRR